MNATKKSRNSILRCVKCHVPISLQEGPIKSIPCAQCGKEYVTGDRYFRYEFDKFLLNNYGSKYLQNKVLNNNAMISYQLLPEGSVSLPDRQDVKHFREFLSGYIGADDTVLDVGCGILSLPGYLRILGVPLENLYGLDPIENQAFDGYRIVGCAEQVPMQNNAVDRLIYATSLDHCCSLNDSLAEAFRVLACGGKMLIWMSDGKRSLRDRLGEFCRLVRTTFQYGLAGSRYVQFPNGTVFYVPWGAADPFHAYLEKPADIFRSARSVGFKLLDEERWNRDEVFLCFQKN